MRNDDDAFEAVKKWWRAWVDLDSRTVEEMAHSAFTERSDTGRLSTSGVRRLLEDASQHRGHCAILDWELSEPDTKRFERVVVCSYAFRITGRQGKHRFVYEGRATDVLSLENGRWTVVSHDGSFQGRRVEA